MGLVSTSGGRAPGYGVQVTKDPLGYGTLSPTAGYAGKNVQALRSFAGGATYKRRPDGTWEVIWNRPALKRGRGDKPKRAPLFKRASVVAGDYKHTGSSRDRSLMSVSIAENMAKGISKGTTIGSGDFQTAENKGLFKEKKSARRVF